MELNAKQFFDGSFAYKALHLHEHDMDIGGGKITKEDIDILAGFPKAEIVAVSGLRQDTFEYLIRTYGRQLKAISFLKNKMVEDWTLLGSLPQLQYIYWFSNHRIEKLWDMSGNTELKGLLISDFTRLHSIEGVEKAPSLRYFSIGNAIWLTMTVDSLMPLANTKITHLEFFGNKIADGNLSFFQSMTQLEHFDCSLKLLPTEHFAWIAANCPNVKGRALCAGEEGVVYETNGTGESVMLPGIYIAGKRKPALSYEGNERRIQKYIDAFEQMKEQYRGIPFLDAFPKYD